MTAHLRARRVGDFLIAHTPRIVISDTYQVMLATALLAMGFITLVSLVRGEATGVMTHALPLTGLRIMWGAGLTLGGTLQLAGIQRSDRDTERAGLAFSAIGAGVYSIALFANTATSAGLILGFVFGFMCLAFCLRLYVSTVARRSRTGVT